VRGDDDDPDIHPLDTPADKYIMSLYWSCMTLTTVGYGDVAAHTTAEYLVAIILMLSGGMVWAYILGSFCTVVLSMDTRGAVFRQTVDDLNFMLEDRAIPRPLRVRVRQFFYQTQHMSAVKGYGELLLQMSPKLRQEVAFSAHQEWVGKIWYLESCSPAFVGEIAQSFRAMMYAPQELLDMPATIYIITKQGVVFRKAMILNVGSIWGEDCILQDVSLMDTACALAMSYVEVVTLCREDLLAVMEEYPEEKSKINWARIKIAIVRGVLKAQRKEEEDKQMADAKKSGDAKKIAHLHASQSARAKQVMEQKKRILKRSPAADSDLDGVRKQITKLEKSVESVLEALSGPTGPAVGGTGRSRSTSGPAGGGGRSGTAMRKSTPNKVRGPSSAN
jgi:hypothetical protein